MPSGAVLVAEAIADQVALADGDGDGDGRCEARAPLTPPPKVVPWPRLALDYGGQRLAGGMLEQRERDSTADERHHDERDRTGAQCRRSRVCAAASGDAGVLVRGRSGRPRARMASRGRWRPQRTGASPARSTRRSCPIAGCRSFAGERPGHSDKAAQDRRRARCPRWRCDGGKMRAEGFRFGLSTERCLAGRSSGTVSCFAEWASHDLRAGHGTAGRPRGAVRAGSRGSQALPGECRTATARAGYRPGGFLRLPLLCLWEVASPSLG